ncbi:MAG: ATP-binding protein [Pseudomonadota bacterium]
MGARTDLPISGILLASLTLVALLLLSVDPIASFAIFILWVGTLLLASLRPPEEPSLVEDVAQVELSATRDSRMQKVIEEFSTPLLVTERGTISGANRAARLMLGQHIIGQDARVAFRQPEAIHLLGDDRSGKALVRGLVRRQDVWQINRHVIDRKLSILELINQSAEADISRAHTDFVANASHELRTPLASILGYVETLADSSDTLDSPTSQKFLGIIEREAQRLQSLVSDLMSLSRVEAEKHDLPTELLDLGPLIDRAARDAAGTARMERLDLHLSHPAEVRGDGQQIEQLVRNLVDNALKYGSPDTPVKVELARSEDGRARLTVSDKGEGIAPEQIPHLTRRFYRTDPGRSRASGGTGLGLAIVKHIVERHKGRLDIESALGDGTRVIVRLPIEEEEEANALAGTVEATSDNKNAGFGSAQRVS